MSNNPNVILICVDQWTGQLLGCSGHPSIQTPTLDALSRNGTRYSRAYSECPVCVPARRTLMTGTSSRLHGDRSFRQDAPMPALPTLAQAFRDGGYQASAVGKLHVFPQRSRIGFDDVILSEEGRTQWGLVDDYDAYLARSGYWGQHFAHAMSNNQYIWRPWHLPEEVHETNWATKEMVRTIRRRDPTRPAFWYLSYSAPHPPLTPLKDYLYLYENEDIDAPVLGDWVDSLPGAVCAKQTNYFPSGRIDSWLRGVRKAFYAQCTHIDHQIRLVIGALREEGILDNTVIMFTSDHGDMLGDHGLLGKRFFYEKSANIPMLLIGQKNDDKVACNLVDDRLVGLQDVMPTLLELAGIPVPDTVEGASVVGEYRREFLYGEFGESHQATRMIHEGRFKLIYYPSGNYVQLFDLETDPMELVNLSQKPDFEEIKRHLLSVLASQLYGADVDWLENDEFTGLSNNPDATKVTGDRSLMQQRSIY
ncbi:sulfatase-like hydrolase/transferase [Modicisalibacter radicis]|uniref:sulfatase-like hydrolase/transferase n=1 Tax=Halomonas sp. EAR18 TaxID=2518972 RepID=UPI00109CD334|nr:sulfatase-like hydrolase/transferase [Halomonas sp. EAR18]